MADDYTPTTEEVRGDYANFQLPASGGDFKVEYADALAEFDRWMADMLAAHDAEKRAEWETEQREVAWEIGYQLLDPFGNSVSVGWPFPSVAEADESGARRAREESDCDPMWPTAHRVVRRRVAGEWLPVEQEDNR